MKRLHTGLIILDPIDIICISFSAGSGIACLVRIVKKYKQNRGTDPIIAELKEKSPIIMVSEQGKPLKLPLIRGGDKIKGISIVFKNKKLRKIIKSIVMAKRKQRQLQLLGNFFFMCNVLLTYGFGLRFAVGGSLNYTQIVLLAFPSTIGGLLLGLVTTYPIFSILIPLAILYGRGIENLPSPSEKCRILCKAAEQYRNRQLVMEMKNFNSLVEDAATALQLPFDEVPLLCVEEKLSLLERYRLKEIVKSIKAQKRIQHFSEFIKKFPECDANPEAVYEEILNSKEKIKLLN